MPETSTSHGARNHVFCPLCGETLEDRFVADEGRNRLVCRGCGSIHYLNPTVVAGTIPVLDGKVWLLRRAIEPRYGAWTYPAGFVELGETVAEAAMRETREEINLEVRLGDVLGVYSRPGMSSVVIVYLAESLSEPSVGAETLEFGLFGVDQIPWKDLAFWSTEAALRDWTEHVGS